MIDENKQAHEIILSIYDTALDPKNWPSVLDEICVFVGAVGALVIDIEGDKTSGRLIPSLYTTNYDALIANAYLDGHRSQELNDQDVFECYSNRKDRIELVSDHVLAASREELELRANVVAMKSIGLRYRAGALLNKDLKSKDRFGFQFNSDQGPLNSENVRKASILLPHIAKALDVSRPMIQLSAKYNQIIDAINMLKTGVCIIDHKQRVVAKNLEFERQTEGYSVFSIERDGRLTFSNQTNAKMASDMFSSTKFHGRFGARPRKEALGETVHSDIRELCIEITPLQGAAYGDGNLSKGSVVFSLDTSQNADIDFEKFSSSFGFTPAETKVLQLLSSGLTNPQIADCSNKSVETINTQVKSLLSKTMTSNRTQLIRLASQTGISIIT